MATPYEGHIPIACSGAGGRVGFEISINRAGPLMRSVIRLKYIVSHIRHRANNESTPSNVDSVLFFDDKKRFPDA